MYGPLVRLMLKQQRYKIKPLEEVRIEACRRQLEAIAQINARIIDCGEEWPIYPPHIEEE